MTDDIGQALEFKYIAAVFRAGVSAGEIKRQHGADDKHRCAGDRTGKFDFALFWFIMT